MVLIIIALNSFHVAISYATEAIQTMTSFILALIPLLLALIASSGGLVSAGFFHPVILFLMNTSGVFIQYVVLPLIFLSAILSIVSTLTEQYKVTQLAQLLRNVAIGGLAVFLTVFLGVISVQGASLCGYGWYRTSYSQIYYRKFHPRPWQNVYRCDGYRHQCLCIT